MSKCPTCMEDEEKTLAYPASRGKSIYEQLSRPITAQPINTRIKPRPRDPPPGHVSDSDVNATSEEKTPATGGPTEGTGTGDMFPESQGTQLDTDTDESDTMSLAEWDALIIKDIAELKQSIKFDMMQAQLTQPSHTVNDTVDLRSFVNGEMIMQ